MQEQANELTRQVGFFQLQDVAVAAPVKARNAGAAAEVEAVIAAVRNAPTPSRASRVAETADAGAWKEF